MMTNTIPYRRTKTHIWDKVLMGIWVHPKIMVMTMMTTVMMMIVQQPWWLRACVFSTLQSINQRDH